MGKKYKKSSAKKGFNKITIVYIVFSLLLILPGVLGWVVLRKDSLTCANSISCINDLSGNIDANAKEGIFLGKKVVVPAISDTFLARVTSLNSVLGSSTEKKRIEVDLSTQHLYAYEGDKQVFSFPVSTGKWGRTPTGTFSIWIKLRATRMTGGQGSDFYDLPNVPYVMFFYNNDIPKSMGFSLHGAYWHNNFGYPMSHGCVNMRTEDVAQLYEWANPTVSSNTTYATKDNPGTEIVIYGTTPI